MPIPSQYSSLIRRMLVLSMRGQLPWQPGPNQYMFLVTVAKMTMRLEDAGTPDGTEFKVSLLSPQGNVIDAFTVNVDDDDEFATIEELFGFARRAATGADEAIATLDAALKELEDADLDSLVDN